MNWIFSVVLFVLGIVVYVDSLDMALKHGYVSNEPSFKTFWGVSLQQCRNECQRYSHICTGIAYSRYNHQCLLYKSAGSNAVLTKDRKFVYSSSSSWQQVPPQTCDGDVCSLNEVCDQLEASSSVCVKSFCDEPTPIDYARTFGNTNEIGSTRLYRCDGASVDGPSEKSIECLQSGLWSPVSLICLPFGEIYVNTYLPSNNIVEYSGMTREECVRQCYNNNDLCMAVNYYNENGTCFFADNQIKKIVGKMSSVYPLSGWEVIHKIFPVIHAWSAAMNTYDMNHSEAVQRCLDLSTSIASLSDVHLAFDNGYSLCSCGFVSDFTDRAIIPMHIPITGCFQIVGVSMCLWRSTFNVFCKNQAYRHA